MGGSFLEKTNMAAVDLLAKARERTSAELEALIGKLPKRHKSAVDSIKTALLHERSAVDLEVDNVRNLETIIAAKDTTITLLQQSVDHWREIAQRYGADMDNARQRAH